MTIQRIAVIGLGLIGGSVGAALQHQGRIICGFDATPGRAELARSLQLITEAAPSLEAAVEETAVVILATPITAIIKLLPAVDEAAPEDALIMDTGSVKVPVLQAMAELPGASRAIGGHPLAGSQRSGPQAANSSLFQSTNFVLTPSAVTTAETEQRAQDLVRVLGAHPLVMAAEEHDRTVAQTSHLPQVLSSVLAGGINRDMAELAGPALQDMTRLAASDVQMWRDILLSNRSNVVGAARRYLNDLEQAVYAVDSGDALAIERLIQNGQSGRDLLETVSAP